MSVEGTRKKVFGCKPSSYLGQRRTKDTGLQKLLAGRPLERCRGITGGVKMDDRNGNGRKRGKKTKVRLTVGLKKNRECVVLACTKDQLRATRKEWGDEEKLTRTQKEVKESVFNKEIERKRVSPRKRWTMTTASATTRGEGKNDDEKKTTPTAKDE